MRKRNFNDAVKSRLCKKDHMTESTLIRVSVAGARRVKRWQNVSVQNQNKRKIRMLNNATPAQTCPLFAVIALLLVGTFLRLQ